VLPTILTFVVAALWLGAMVYCALAIRAGARFRAAAARKPAAHTPFVSMLKPLVGLERDLEAHLESFFLQDYPAFEILFSVHDPADPALAVVERLRQRHPKTPAHVVVAANPPYPNAKVWAMERMAAAARGEALVVSDSDVFVGSDYLREVVAHFGDPQVGVVTCVYRGVPGRGFWSRLEALAQTTEFMPGCLVAWDLEGMKYALGPTMAVSRRCLEAVGGFPAMAEYLADDFVLGQWADQKGYRVVLSPYVVNHQIVGEGFRATFLHRLRWARSTRFSRPLGYFGELFTHPIPAALALWALAPMAWWASTAVAVTVAMRWLVCRQVGWGVLRDPSLARAGTWWLVPLQDLVSFAVWLGGFTGRKVLWRGVRYAVGRQGKFVRLSA
jgi:ceramide glucosyltransferase